MIKALEALGGRGGIIVRPYFHPCSGFRGIPRVQQNTDQHANLCLRQIIYPTSDLRIRFDLFVLPSGTYSLAPDPIPESPSRILNDDSRCDGYS